MALHHKGSPSLDVLRGHRARELYGHGGNGHTVVRCRPLLFSVVVVVDDDVVVVVVEEEE